MSFELFKLWGMLGGSALIGILFVASAFFLPDRFRQLAIMGALCSFLFSVVFGLGANSRDGLCKAQMEHATQVFTNYIEDVRRQINDFSASLEATLKQKDDQNAAKVAEMEAKLLSRSACMPSAARLDELRSLRSAPVQSGKR